MGFVVRASTIVLLLLLIFQPHRAVSRQLRATGTNSADSDGEGELIGSAKETDLANTDGEGELISGEEPVSEPGDDDKDGDETEERDDDYVDEEGVPADPSMDDEDDAEREADDDAANDGSNDEVGKDDENEADSKGDDEEDERNEDDANEGRTDNDDDRDRTGDSDDEERNKDEDAEREGDDDDERNENDDTEREDDDDERRNTNDGDDNKDDDDEDDSKDDDGYKVYYLPRYPSDDEDSKDSDDQSSRDDIFPPCFQRREGWKYEGRSGKGPAKTYDDAEKCVEKCYCDDCEIDFVMWDERNERCECWKQGDGEWERTSNNDLYTFDTSSCYPDEDSESSSEVTSSERTKTVDIEEEQRWGATPEDMECGPMIEFLVIPNFACVTQSYKTVNMNDTFPMTNDRREFADWSAETKWQNRQQATTGQFQYDGTYEACLELFRLNHYNRLYWDIGAGVGSWFTHDKATQECRLYDGSGGPAARQCSELRYSWDMTVGKYCNAWAPWGEAM
eukprot:jgi/Tetstr1/447032/TSEL_034489.t1